LRASRSATETSQLFQALAPGRRGDRPAAMGFRRRAHRQLALEGLLRFLALFGAPREVFLDRVLELLPQFGGIGAVKVDHVAHSEDDPVKRVGGIAILDRRDIALVTHDIHGMMSPPRQGVMPALARNRRADVTEPLLMMPMVVVRRDERLGWLSATGANPGERIRSRPVSGTPDTL